MTAKEIQTEVIKTYFKPTLKEHGYYLNGQTWRKDKGDFFIIINLQNFSWNSRESVDFCFNVGVALKVTMNEDELKSPKAHNMSVYLREDFYLPNERKTHKYRNKSGYTMSQTTNLSEFKKEFKKDFEEFVLPFLNKLNSIDDCLEHFGNIAFWGENLRKVLIENKLLAD